MKLTIPNSILIGSLIIALSIFARIDDTKFFIKETQADINTFEFEYAVINIVERCTINDGSLWLKSNENHKKHSIDC